jgi:hypothetical protein
MSIDHLNVVRCLKPDYQALPHAILTYQVFPSKVPAGDVVMLKSARKVKVTTTGSSDIPVASSEIPSERLASIGGPPGIAGRSKNVQHRRETNHKSPP